MARVGNSARKLVERARERSKKRKNKNPGPQKRPGSRYV